MAATMAITGQYLRPTMAKPTALSPPLMAHITSCPRTTPASPSSIRERSASKLARPSGRTSDRKKATIRSRVIMMYAASMSVMKKMKIVRLIVATRSRNISATSSEFC